MLNEPPAAAGSTMGYERRVFSDYTLDNLNAILRGLSEKQGGKVSTSLRFAAGPLDAVVVNFLRGPRIEFVVPPEFPSEERRDYYTNRWMATHRLFCEVKIRYPSLTGGCRLWIDDLASGPGLAFCGAGVSHVLIPDSVYLETGGYAEARQVLHPNRIPWEKRIDKVFWRGASTGSRNCLRLQQWQDIPRFKLCLAVREIQRDDLFDVGLSSVVQIWDEAEKQAIAKCDLARPPVPPATFMHYRHSIDIDGNTCSWPGLFHKLIMGHTIIKIDSEMGFRQWYYDRLIPWKNFAPVSASMRELKDVAEWLRGQPGEAHRIAQNASRLADDLTEDKVFDDVVPRIHEYASR
jgi:hypothetical protein